jgi:hypothetical protein
LTPDWTAMSEIYDPIARSDQACKDAELTARLFVSFHRTLAEAGIHEVTINELMKIYATRLFREDRANR